MSRIGLIVSCFGLVACAATSPGAVAEAVTSGDGPGGAHVVYLNFGGLAVQPGTDDATQNQSAIVSKLELVPAFDAAPYAPQLTPDQARSAITSQVAQFFAPFNVQVVMNRPPTGRYTMAVIGGDAGSVGLPQTGASGAAPVDCGNTNESNVVFVFSTVLVPANYGSSPYSAVTAVAITTAKEVGRTFGLTDTENDQDVMNTTLNVGLGGIPTATGFASGLHTAIAECSAATQQDSAALLAMNIGAAAAPDGGVPGSDAAPVLDLASVLDESVPADAALDLLAADDLAVHVAPDASIGGNGGGCSVGGHVAGDALFAGLAVLVIALGVARSRTV